MLLLAQSPEPSLQLICDPSQQGGMVFAFIIGIKHPAISKADSYSLPPVITATLSNKATPFLHPSLVLVGGNLVRPPKDRFHFLHQQLLLLVLLLEFDVVGIGRQLITVGKYHWQHNEAGHDRPCHKCSLRKQGFLGRLPHRDILLPVLFR